MRHLVNAYEVEAGTVKFAGNTVWSVPERFWCGVSRRGAISSVRTFTFTYLYVTLASEVTTTWSYRNLITIIIIIINATADCQHFLWSPQLPSQSQGITVLWPVPNYTAWDRGTRVRACVRACVWTAWSVTDSSTPKTLNCEPNALNTVMLQADGKLHRRNVTAHKLPKVRLQWTLLKPSCIEEQS